MPKFKPKAQTTIEAWQYQPDKPIPAWAARHVHAIGDEEHSDYRTLRDWRGALHTVKPGDFIIKQGDSKIDGVYRPVKESAFLDLYELIPE